MCIYIDRYVCIIDHSYMSYSPTCPLNRTVIRLPWCTVSVAQPRTGTFSFRVLAELGKAIFVVMHDRSLMRELWGDMDSGYFGAWNIIDSGFWYSGEMGFRIFCIELECIMSSHEFGAWNMKISMSHDITHSQWTPATCYPLVMTSILLWKITIEIVNFPMNSMVIFHSYVNVYQRVMLSHIFFGKPNWYFFNQHHQVSHHFFLRSYGELNPIISYYIPNFLVNPPYVTWWNTSDFTVHFPKKRWFLAPGYVCCFMCFNISL